MAKRLSEKQKKEITIAFTEGQTIECLSNLHGCSKLTISRNLKKNLGEMKYKTIFMKNKSLSKINSDKESLSLKENNLGLLKEVDSEFANSQKNKDANFEEGFNSLNPFTEIIPLSYEIENVPQKDLSSIPISEMSFPKIVYMIVNNKIELETKYLKDYPEWQFLSQNDLNRKTIQIFMDLKNAKRFCTKDQKVIKIPNTDVFRIVSPILISRGISRIVSEEKLIAL